MHHHLRLVEQTHRGPATGRSYDKGEGQTNSGAGPKLPSARSLFSSKALAPERAKKEKARRAKERVKRELKPNFQHLKTLKVMINYSITARAVNPNLFEINQAKTRINQAKAEGKQPDPKDEALVGTVVTNYFATAQYTEVMTIEKFARHIADHGTTYSRADIMAILYMAVDCMREQLLEGKKIRLGELGDFSVALSSKGAETAEKFSSQNIQRVTVCWEPGSEFRNLLADAEFNLVATRSAQAAVLKAIKEGKTNVDISAPVTPGNPGGGSPSGGTSNPGGTTGQTKKRTLTVRSANESQGSVSGGGTFDEGSTQTVRATPKTGFAFDKWSDGSTQNPRTVKLTSDLTLTASFKTATTGGGDQGSGEDSGTLGD